MMGLRVTEDAAEIVSGCAVPHCEREVVTSLPREALAEQIENAEGAGRIVARMLSRVLEEAEGDELPTPDVLELPPMICDEHAGVLDLLRDYIQRMAEEYVPLPAEGAGGAAPDFEFVDDDQEADDG